MEVWLVFSLLAVTMIPGWTLTFTITQRSSLLERVSIGFALWVGWSLLSGVAGHLLGSLSSTWFLASQITWLGLGAFGWWRLPRPIHGLDLLGQRPHGVYLIVGFVAFFTALCLQRPMTLPEVSWTQALDLQAIMFSSVFPQITENLGVPNPQWNLNIASDTLLLQWFAHLDQKASMDITLKAIGCALLLPYGFGLWAWLKRLNLAGIYLWLTLFAGMWMPLVTVKFNGVSPDSVALSLLPCSLLMIEMALTHRSFKSWVGVGLLGGLVGLASSAYAAIWLFWFVGRLVGQWWAPAKVKMNYLSVGTPLIIAGLFSVVVIGLTHPVSTLSQDGLKDFFGQVSAFEMKDIGWVHEKILEGAGLTHVIDEPFQRSGFLEVLGPILHGGTQQKYAWWGVVFALIAFGVVVRGLGCLSRDLVISCLVSAGLLVFWVGGVFFYSDHYLLRSHVVKDVLPLVAIFILPFFGLSFNRMWEGKAVSWQRQMAGLVALLFVSGGAVNLQGMHVVQPYISENGERAYQYIRSRTPENAVFLLDGVGQGVFEVVSGRANYSESRYDYGRDQSALRFLQTQKKLGNFLRREASLDALRDMGVNYFVVGSRDLGMKPLDYDERRLGLSQYKTVAQFGSVKIYDIEFLSQHDDISGNF